jgi:hypothetical protein
MNRREFITLVGGAVTWPLAARRSSRRRRSSTLSAPDRSMRPRLAPFNIGNGVNGPTD